MSNKPITFEKLFPYLMVVILTPVMFAMGLGAGYMIWGEERNAAQGQEVEQVDGTDVAQATTQPDAQQVTRYEVPVDDDPSIGAADAPVTIIEFSDYECPYCKRWHDETFDLLMDEFSDQILFVYRDFPLSFHANAASAAEAANCAGAQDAYWEYYAALFSYELSLGAEAYQSYAEELGLDMTAFNTCMENHTYYDEVMADFEFASNLGVTGTPTFFINGIPIVGAQPYEVFKQVIEDELANNNP